MTTAMRQLLVRCNAAVRRLARQRHDLAAVATTRGAASNGARDAKILGVVALTAVGVAALALDDDAECNSLQQQPRRGKYVLYKELGRGGFSVVHLALDTSTNELVAAKIFDPKFSSSQDIQQEIETMRFLGKHRNIVSLHDVMYSHNETILFTDLVEGGELFDYIFEMGSISERDASRLLHDACLALDYVHSHGVCHRDIKPENVLLTNQSNDADIKIADFGLSRRLRSHDKLVENQPSGTIAYWAPEIIRRQPHDFGVDMWAFGVVAYITLTGVHPFDPRGDRSDAEIIAQIAKGAYDVDNEWYKALTDDAREFLARLLDPNPETRFTAKQALQHPWLRGLTTGTTPLPDGHGQRLQSYQRLQKLRANILAVIMGVQHLKFSENTPLSPKPATSSHEPQRTSTVNMDMFREAFALFDKDESGGIDKNELAHVMQSLGQQVSEAELKAIMAEADADGDGKISFLEFVSMMNKRLFRRGELRDGDLKAAFDVFDRDHDGFISRNELEHIFHVLGSQTTTSDDIQQLIQTVDANGDGKIDYEEFCELMRIGLGTRKAGQED
ncbi:hypothetical protein Poli38472_006531 [Pythium oligandrum]|uniref:Calmodulin n=1 Tax=Pythium oligandrum TaxID=41045 RepID=A0A8K1FBW1_PYTOL|nr:hypothetical protein Poli38472_006531 [Pythium oligandrum]|eukprot:TMW56521.1 hypothetical protein Poli38472_006531 [Pythium oligandrum]